MLEIDFQQQFIHQLKLFYEHFQTVRNQLIVGKLIRFLANDGYQCTCQMLQPLDADKNNISNSETKI